MIEARKQPLFEAVFDVYTRRLLRRHFHAIHLRADPEFLRRDTRAPMLLCPNHSSWWDALVPFFLARRVLHLDSYAMMDEEQLARYSFFRRIGVFSVNKRNGRDTVASINYARSLLAVPGRALWFYPQGELRRNDARPLAFARGIEHIAKGVPGLLLVPMGFRYEFLDDQLPELFISIGAPLDAGGRALRVQDLEEAVTTLLDATVRDIVSSDTASYRLVLKGRRSTSGRFDHARGAGDGNA